MKLVIIRSRESLSEKIKKIRSINHNNSPITILTDFSLVGKMTPTNISYYHITDGGDMEDLITIFDLLKSKNFNGVYSRSLNVVNHLAESIKGDKTVNNAREVVFSERLNSSIIISKKIQEKADNLFIKGDEMFVTDLKNMAQIS